jgi:hypothetical protein
MFKQSIQRMWPNEGEAAIDRRTITFNFVSVTNLHCCVCLVGRKSGLSECLCRPRHYGNLSLSKPKINFTIDAKCVSFSHSCSLFLTTVLVFEIAGHLFANNCIAISPIA